MKIFGSRFLFSCGLLLSPMMVINSAQSANLPLVQINVAGAAFGEQKLPGNVGYNYFFPTFNDLEQWRVRHVKVIRFPILWERLQPRLNGDFDPAYATLIDTFLTQVSQKGMTAILDVHNYGAYRGKIVGSSEVPLSAYRDLWSRIAGRWHGRTGLHGYDLMNEPHDEADPGWPAAAQAGIDGVRSVDTIRPIYVEGRAWSSAALWPELNDDLLDLKDPSDQLIFSAHLYLDSNGSGTYQSGPGLLFDPMVGVNRAKAFVEWIERNGKQGHIGEFGFPGDDARWHEAGKLLLQYLKAHCIPVAYWAAGSMWGSYPLSIEPVNGVDRPQWKTLAPFVNSGECKGRF